MPESGREGEESGYLQVEGGKESVVKCWLLLMEEEERREDRRSGEVVLSEKEEKRREEIRIRRKRRSWPVKESERRRGESVCVCV